MFLATGTTPPALPSGRPVTHNAGGLASNSVLNDNSGAVLTSGGTSYVLTRTIYDAGGRTIAILADNTGETSFVYDGADRQIQVTDAMSNVVENQFDPSGNLTVSTRTEYCTITATPAIAAETFSSAMFYDCLNRLVLQAAQGADGNLNLDLVAVSNTTFWQLAGTTLVTCLGYDSRGNRVLSVDPKGNSSLTVFDGASRTIQTQQHLRGAGQGGNPPVNGQTLLPGGGASVVTTLVLDGNGRQTQIIDDRGDITLFAYDTMDREVQMTFQDGSTRTSVVRRGWRRDHLYRRERYRAWQHLRRPGSEDHRHSWRRRHFCAHDLRQQFQYDGLSRMTFARDTDGSTPADAAIV